MRRDADFADSSVPAGPHPARLGDFIVVSRFTGGSGDVRRVNTAVARAVGTADAKRMAADLADEILRNGALGVKFRSTT